MHDETFSVVDGRQQSIFLALRVRISGPLKPCGGRCIDGLMPRVPGRVEGARCHDGREQLLMSRIDG
jgi:hypothetical protein